MSFNLAPFREVFIFDTIKLYERKIFVFMLDFVLFIPSIFHALNCRNSYSYASAVSVLLEFNTGVWTFQKLDFSTIFQH